MTALLDTYLIVRIKNQVLGLTHHDESASDDAHSANTIEYRGGCCLWCGSVIDWVIVILGIGTTDGIGGQR